MKKLITLISVFLIAVLITGCGAFTGDDSGELVMELSDAPVNEIAEVNVAIDSVEVNSQEEGWFEVNDFDDGVETFNLLELRFDEALLGEELLPEGEYNEIRLHLAAKEDADGDTLENEIGESNVVFEDSADRDKVDVFIPSGAQTGLKINHNFRIEDGAVTRLLLDVDVRDILNELPEKAPSELGYVLRPTAIDVIDQVISGDIEGRAVKETGEAFTDYDVIIEAREGDEVLASSIATTEESDDRAAGSFKLRGLEAGEYNLIAYIEDEEGNKIYQSQTDFTAEVEAEEITELEENLVLQN